MEFWVELFWFLMTLKGGDSGKRWVFDERVVFMEEVIVRGKFLNRSFLNN